METRALTLARAFAHLEVLVVDIFSALYLHLSIFRISYQRLLCFCMFVVRVPKSPPFPSLVLSNQASFSGLSSIADFSTFSLAFTTCLTINPAQAL